MDSSNVRPLEALKTKMGPIHHDHKTNYNNTGVNPLAPSIYKAHYLQHVVNKSPLT